jgi:plastocyanin
MHYSAILASIAFAGAALAKDINVAVGTSNGSNVFDPAEVTAEEGDVVWFKFWPKSHSVAQAAFDKPCEPLEGGFWSGYVNTTSTEEAADLHFMYTVTNASAPVWFYCTRMRHCQAGMVGVINPP